MPIIRAEQHTLDGLSRLRSDAAAMFVTSKLLPARDCFYDQETRQAGPLSAADIHVVLAGSAPDRPPNDDYVYQWATHHYGLSETALRAFEEGFNLPGKPHREDIFTPEDDCEDKFGFYRGFDMGRELAVQFLNDEAPYRVMRKNGKAATVYNANTGSYVVVFGYAEGEPGREKCEWERYDDVDEAREAAKAYLAAERL